MPYTTFREAALSCSTEAEFRNSDYFRQHGTRLREFLETPQVFSNPNPNPNHEPAEPAAAHGPADLPLRVVQWNIEKGKELDRIRERLTQEPDLARADIYCLNEVDWGMARSAGNADIARELAEALGCHWVYLPCYLECTKGPLEDEMQAPGDNERGLHGLAILSRHPIRDARGGPLPHCWDYFDYFEKRFGYRQVLAARIEVGGRDIVVATTHLEVRNVPACRARQMKVAVQHLSAAAKDWGVEAAVLTGDFNSNSFRRGGLWNTVREFLRIVTTPEHALDAELRAPFDREPLFRELQSAGFQFRELTDGEATAEQLLGSAEDLEILPKWLADWVSRRFGLGSRIIHMRLDWITARNLRAVVESKTVARGRDPQHPASDHDVVFCDLTF